MSDFQQISMVLITYLFSGVNNTNSYYNHAITYLYNLNAIRLYSVSTNPGKR